MTLTKIFPGLIAVIVTVAVAVFVADVIYTRLLVHFTNLAN